MKLYIKLQNGQPIDHPITEENLLQIYPNREFERSDSDFIEFIKRPIPNDMNPYEIYEGARYEVSVSERVCKEVHYIRGMNNEEKIQKRNEIIENWNASDAIIPKPKSWTFNEELCKYVPPIPYPTNSDSFRYIWDEETLSWICWSKITT